MYQWRNKTTGEVVTAASSPGPDWVYAGAAAKANSVPQDDVHVDGLGVQYTTRGGKAFLFDGTPYNPVPIPQKSQITPIGVGNNLTFEQQQALASTPRTSFSSSTSQSLADPRMLELQQKQLDETIRGNLAQEAKDRELLTFNRDKLRIETQNGDKDRALKTQEMMATIQARIDQNAIARQQLIQQRDMANADREARARETAATLSQRESESMRADSLARDKAVAEYSASPTDVGKVSGFLNAGGQSNLSTAIAQGKSAVNLDPLASLLAPQYAATQQQTQQQPGMLNSAMVQGQGAQTPNPRAGYEGTPYENVNRALGTAQTIDGNGNLFDYQPGQTGLQPVGNERDAANRRMEMQKVPGWVPRFEDGGAVVDSEDTEDMPDSEGDDTFLNGLMKLVSMLGMEPKAVAGEKGKANGETVYSNGDVVVMPDKGKGMTGGPKMAEGGGVLGPLMQFASDFQKKVGQTALQRSGFERAPTPIELSDPGTDPFRQQLGAATTAAITGIPQSSFLNELIRLRPKGMQAGFASRTR